MVDQTAAFETWAVLELMGHRRLSGVVTEAEIAGAGFIHATGDVEPRSRAYYRPGSVYAITPTDEETCRRHATPWSERAQLTAGDDVLELVDEHMDELERENDEREIADTQPAPLCKCGHRYDHHRHHEPTSCYQRTDIGEQCLCAGYEPEDLLF